VSVHKTIEDAVETFLGEGRSNAYVDGGKLIQGFLRAGLIESMIITRAPVLIGQGAPLFGTLDGDIELRHQETKVLGGGFVQSRYLL
jgi:dihydrofolate reductase